MGCGCIGLYAMASSLHCPDWLREYINENAPRGQPAYEFLIEDMDEEDIPNDD